jgi:hypothetical protein
VISFIRSVAMLAGRASAKLLPVIDVNTSIYDDANLSSKVVAGIGGEDAGRFLDIVTSNRSIGKFFFEMSRGVWYFDDRRFRCESYYLWCPIQVAIAGAGKKDVLDDAAPLIKKINELAAPARGFVVEESQYVPRYPHFCVSVKLSVICRDFHRFSAVIDVLEELSLTGVLMLPGGRFNFANGNIARLRDVMGSSGMIDAAKAHHTAAKMVTKEDFKASLKEQELRVKESVEELKALMESKTRDIYSRFEAVSETMESMAGDVAYGTAHVSSQVRAHRVETGDGIRGLAAQNVVNNSVARSIASIVGAQLEAGSALPPPGPVPELSAPPTPIREFGEGRGGRGRGNGRKGGRAQHGNNNDAGNGNNDMNVSSPSNVSSS